MCLCQLSEWLVDGCTKTHNYLCDAEVISFTKLKAQGTLIFVSVQKETWGQVVLNAGDDNYFYLVH